MIEKRECRDCWSFTRTPTPDASHAFVLTCDIRSPEFPNAEVCPCYRPPPKPIVVYETPGPKDGNGEGEEIDRHPF